MFFTDRQLDRQIDRLRDAVPPSPPGSLIQLPSVERGKLSKVRLGSLSLKKEGERQCFLFTKHFLICTRSSGGKLHLLKVSRGTDQPHWPINTMWC
jgi:hypothetical protein